MRALFRCAGVWRFGKLVLAGALSLVVTACNPFTPTYTYRYRITVEVHTPQGLRTGSSVWETSAWQGSGIPDSSIRTSFRGEAVAVDLPNGTLFAVLRPPSLDGDYAVGVVDSQYQANHADLKFDPNEGWKELRRQVKQTRAAMALEPRLYPLLVRFRDVRQPASVEQVEPADLTTSFGSGVRLKRITVQVTDDEVTMGSIEERLPWLNEHVGSFVKTPWGTAREYKPFASRIIPSNFVRI